MSRRHSKRTAVRLRKLAADILYIVYRTQYLFRRFQNCLPRPRNRRDTLAAADENLHAQFLFQQAYLLRHARLRGKQSLRRLRHIQVMAVHLHRVAQLLQLHRQNPASEKKRM